MPTAVVDACVAALAATDGGGPSLRTAVSALDHVVVGGDELDECAVGDTFGNVNTEAELRTAAERLAALDTE
jgi:molybdopterin-guanine dinucleotide biosynthesis protein A